MTDAYRVLGVQRGASAEEVKRAWKARVKSCHPDVVATESASVQKIKAAEYRQLTEAYESLTGRGGGTGGSAGSSQASSSNSHTRSAYYRADGYHRQGSGGSGQTFGSFGSFGSYAAWKAQNTARNSWQNGGLLVLSCVFFVGLTAFEPIVEGWWEQRNAGKLFKDIAKGTPE